MALTEKHRKILEKLGLPTDFSDLTDDQYNEIDDKVCAEMQLHGLNDAGDGLNGHGELCVDILDALPDA